VGTVSGSDPADAAWAPIRQQLAGWKFVAGLGDNHAAAVGCGMKDDYRTLVISAGTSGTINYSCPATAALPDDSSVLRFEFYQDSLLLLLMLGDCAAWYNRFLDHFAAGYKSNLDYLNMAALSADLRHVRRVVHQDGRRSELFPPIWPALPLAEQVASTQFSIMLELLLRVGRMQGDLRAAELPGIATYVLTGGLSQSPFFQHVFHAGIGLLNRDAEIKVSARSGPLRYKSSALGALINAQLPLVTGKLGKLHEKGGRFPLKDCAQADFHSRVCLDYLLQSYGVCSSA
jgi:sugar (pentulose or hexulose) kinase